MSTTVESPPSPPESAVAAPAPRPFKWTFATALPACLVLMVAGHIIGNLLGEWPPMRVVLMALRGDIEGSKALLNGLVASMRILDWVLLACLLSTTTFVVLMRHAFARFFRTMQVGVSLIVLATVAIFAGVLVPQIENFEDPEERVTAANYERNYQAFAWAESYFFYHLVRPYGWRMPKAEVPQQALDSLERFGRIYGEQEAKNRGKMMRASFAGMEKTAQVEALMKGNDNLLRSAFDAATFLELNRAYKSNWFATLMFLIGTAVFLNTFRPGMSKKWFTMQKIGFFVTHLGILTLLGGGLVSHLLTDRGIIELYLGEGPRDVYYQHYRTNKLARMPFGIKLEHFARKEWKALEVYSMEEDFKSRPPLHTLWPGREIPLDYAPTGPDGEYEPRLLLRVKELHDKAVVGAPRMVEAPVVPGERAKPVAVLEVPGFEEADHAPHPGHELHAETRRTVNLSKDWNNQGYFDPAAEFRLVVAHDTDPMALFPSHDGVHVGVLDVEVRTDLRSRPIPVPVVLGERVSVPGGYELEFVDATANLDVRGGHRDEAKMGSPDPRPLDEQEFGFAAIWVDIHPPDGGAPERRLVVEVIDALEYGLQEDYEQSDVIARLRWNRWTAPGPPRFALAWGGGDEPRLVAEDGSSQAVALGAELPLPGDTEVVAQAFYENATPEKDITFLETRRAPDGWDASFYERSPRGLVLEVVHFPGTEDEVVEEVSMATSEEGSANLWATGDERFLLRFIENTSGFPFDWRSVLSVWEPDADGRPVEVDVGSEKSREIRVNDYFTYRGYRFFQTNAEPDDPTYSGIGVVYDPGIRIVLLGMYTIIAGTLLAFIVRPIVLARRRKTKEKLA